MKTEYIVENEYREYIGSTSKLKQAKTLIRNTCNNGFITMKSDELTYLIVYQNNYFKEEWRKY